MLHVLGVGHAWPEGRLSDEFLEDVIESTEVRANSVGVQSRASVLTEEYIALGKNKDVEEAEKVASDTPTDLSERAARLALERAGLHPEDLGLILAGVCTPQQTTPSEAQRMGKRLGQKVPAYDLYSASSDFSLHVSTLLDWKEERIPEYVLSASTGCVTTRLSYQSGEEPFIFGDGAAAMVLSSRHTGKLQVRDSDFLTEPENADLFFIELYGHLRLSPHALADWIAPRTHDLLVCAIEKNSLDVSRLKWICPQLSPSSMQDIASRIGIAPENHWHNTERVGCSLGASPLTVLSERWEQLTPGECVVLSTAGPGMSAGYIVLQTVGG
ncbi:MAG: hypothetical protein KDD55_01080 [Bdellovibrionales bacterium]|nr:hypothetical protein [Bdellovibrionales bacterium]